MSLFHPTSIRCCTPLRTLSLIALLLPAVLPARAAKPSGPVLSIALTDLGYQPLPARDALNGDTLFTINFIDERHLLVTFATRSLLKRLPDAEADDQDRAVQALVLELPTGQVVARTTWRLRDHGQYLFPLGHGRFLLRVRNHLSLLDPLRYLATDPIALAAAKPDAFKEEDFVELHRHFGYLTVSPGGDLLTIETTHEVKKKKLQLAGAGPTGAAGAIVPDASIAPDAEELIVTRGPEVQINFFRLLTDPVPGGHEKLVAQSSGVVGAHNLVEIPATAEGYLRVTKEAAGPTYDFDFIPHEGKLKELSPFDTGCAPRPFFISRSEFIAFGCAGSTDKQQMAAFNMRGEATWISVFSNHHLFPYLVTAPAGGRFAFSRTITSGTYLDVDNLTADQIASQEVTVYQNDDGRQLLKLQTSPFQRSGQNFDLSADGLQAAAIRNAHVEVYPLAPLTKKDQQAIAAAAADAPPRSEARISLGATSVSDRRETATATRQATAARGAAGGEPVSRETEPVAATAQGASDSSDANTAEPNTTVNGDEQKRRTPPTLYDTEHPKPQP